MLKEALIHIPKNLSIEKIIQFVDKANTYECDVIINVKLFKTNAKSLLSFSLAVIKSKSNNILVQADGPDALEAIEHLSSVFKTQRK